MGHSTRALVLLSLFGVFGCGRSGLFGGSEVPECPLGAICDMAFFDDGGIDMRRGDGGDMAQPDPCADPNNCQLPQCVGDVRCRIPGTEVCNNGIDDDDDNTVDCDDADCQFFPGCDPNEMCDPLNPDCLSPVCAMHPQCQDLRCMPTVEFGTLAPTNSSSTKMVNTTGTVDVDTTPCAPGGAGMIVGKFTLSGPQSDVTLSYTQPQGRDHVFGVFRAGVNQNCAQNLVSCYDPQSATMGQRTFQALMAGNYYVIAQPFSPAGQGAVSITLSTPSTPEICNNGVDDNNNGLIDCAEASCAQAANCVDVQCNPDINLGALVVNGPSKIASFNTELADADNSLTCQAASGGKDVVVRFTLQETAGVQLRWQQTGDHVVGFMRLPPPGQPCDADQLGCYDPNGRTQDNVAFGEFPPGQYALLFKGLQPGAEGSITAEVSAYRNRRLELCNNNIDDNNDGLIDCADPDCQGVSGCSAPFCMPDIDFGVMMPDDFNSASLNISQNGHAGYSATCAQGGGKGMVVHLEVSSVGGAAIGFDCSQTGDHVLTLNSAGGPREACDVNERTCADPNTLPFGCGYIIPNIQPGAYNIIVQSFRPGSEGNVELSISVFDDRQLEICNNNIDDDMDGDIDCEDRKCVTEPQCASHQCRADQTIAPVPLNGSTVFRQVQTSGNGSQISLPCATAPGGQTGVVELQLTSAADLTLQWNQIGNHNFALYDKDGSFLPCDAGTMVSCVESNNAASGMTSYTNLAQGSYYLVVGADAPDGMTQSSGVVTVALSGLPH